MRDYLIQFKVQGEPSSLAETTRQLVAIVERTRSSIGGGCDQEQGEFYIHASRSFQRADIVEMVALLLPNTESLTITAQTAARANLRPVLSQTREKRARGKTKIAPRNPTRPITRKVSVKI